MHELHLAIGDILKTIETSNLRVLLDRVCGGNGPLVCFNGRCYDGVEVCLAQVDAAVAFNGEINIAIEIEETDLRPLAFCGKIMGAALSQYCKWDQLEIPLSSKLLFIQIFRKKSEHSKWSKYAQCRYLQTEIGKLRSEQFRIADYQFHYGTANEYRNDPSHRDELVKEIRDFIR